MKKYNVTLYYHTMASAIVEAESEDEAIELAYDAIGNEELLDNMQEDNDPGEGCRRGDGICRTRCN